MQVEMNIMHFMLNKKARIRSLLLILGLCLFCENVLAQKRENNLQNILAEIQESRPIGRMEVRYYGGAYHPTPFSLLGKFDEHEYVGMLNTKAKVHVKNFKQALQNTKVTEGEHTMFPRAVLWGLILFDKEDQLIASIYFSIIKEYADIFIPSDDRLSGFSVILEPKNTDKWLPSWVDNFRELFSPTTDYFRKYCTGKRPNIDGLSDEERSIDAFIKDLTALCSQNDED